jgi:hypothetical protein
LLRQVRKCLGDCRDVELGPRRASRMARFTAAG